MNFIEKVKQFPKDKKGMTDIVDTYTYGIIGIVVLFYVLANMIPVGQDAGDCLAASGVPLASLFGGKGVIFLIIMATVLIGVIRSLRKKGK